MHACIIHACGHMSCVTQCPPHRRAIGSARRARAPAAHIIWRRYYGGARHAHAHAESSKKKQKVEARGLSNIKGTHRNATQDGENFWDTAHLHLYYSKSTLHAVIPPVALGLAPRVLNISEGVVPCDRPCVRTTRYTSAPNPPPRRPLEPRLTRPRPTRTLRTATVHHYRYIGTFIPRSVAQPTPALSPCPHAIAPTSRHCSAPACPHTL